MGGGGDNLLSQNIVNLILEIQTKKYRKYSERKGGHQNYRKIFLVNVINSW